MKKLLTALLLITTVTVSAQIEWKTVAIRSSLLFVSGFADGTSEVLKVKYESFERVFPDCNDQFWNYNQSWTNKYKPGTHNPRFPGSTHGLVWTTDGYHLTRMIRNCTMITAVVIPIRGKKNWKAYVLEGATAYLSYQAGFNLAYDVVFE